MFVIPASRELHVDLVESMYRSVLHLNPPKLTCLVGHQIERTMFGQRRKDRESLLEQINLSLQNTPAPPESWRGATASFVSVHPIQGSTTGFHGIAISITCEGFPVTVQSTVPVQFPGTGSSLKGRCSIQLSYGRFLSQYANLLKIRINWSGQTDSNRRPSAPKADALPDCAMPRCQIFCHTPSLPGPDLAGARSYGRGPDQSTTQVARHGAV